MSLTQLLHIDTLIKIAILAIIFLYDIFLFVIFNQIRSMNRLVSQSVFSTGLQVVALLFILVGILLFFAALVIL